MTRISSTPTTRCDLFPMSNSWAGRERCFGTLRICAVHLPSSIPSSYIALKTSHTTNFRKFQACTDCTPWMKSSRSGMTSKHHNLGLENVAVGTFQRGCRLGPTALAKRKTTPLLFHARSTTHMPLVRAGSTRQRMQSDYRILSIWSSARFFICSSHTLITRIPSKLLKTFFAHLQRWYFKCLCHSLFPKHTRSDRATIGSLQNPGNMIQKPTNSMSWAKECFEFHDTYNSKLHLKCMVVSPRRLFNLMRQFHHELNCDSIRRLFRLLSKRGDHMQKSMMKALLLDPIIYFNWTYRLWILLPCQHRRWQDDS